MDTTKRIENVRRSQLSELCMYFVRRTREIIRSDYSPRRGIVTTKVIKSVGHGQNNIRRLKRKSFSQTCSARSRPVHAKPVYDISYGSRGHCSRNGVRRIRKQCIANDLHELKKKKRTANVRSLFY